MENKNIKKIVQILQRASLYGSHSFQNKGISYASSKLSEAILEEA